MAKRSATERAEKLLASPAAKGRPDFALRAAACHALAPLGHIAGFEIASVWPGRLQDFEPLAPDEHAALAAELMALQRRTPTAAA